MKHILWLVMCCCFGVITPTLAMPQDEPIDIISDRLEYTQQNRTALFEGDVKVTHGKLALGSDYLKIKYKEDQGVENIVARGHVTVVDGENTATSDTAHYNPSTGTVTMVGNVKMLRDGNVLTGEELYYDPEKGTMKLANEAEQGRVRASFTFEDVKKAEE